MELEIFIIRRRKGWSLERGLGVELGGKGRR
jgi:hypothetical protein